MVPIGGYRCKWLQIIAGMGQANSQEVVPRHAAIRRHYQSMTTQVKSLSLSYRTGANNAACLRR